MAGVVGTKTPRYLLFGHTVNLASKCEETGSSGRVHISEVTADLIKEDDRFIITDDEPIKSGDGQLMTYWVEFNT